MLAASEYVRQWGALNALVLVLLFGLWRWTQRAEAARLAARARAATADDRALRAGHEHRASRPRWPSSQTPACCCAAWKRARQTLGNECLRRAVLDATARIEGGSGLGAALRQQKVFPPLLCHLVSSGEKTGTLSRMLDRAAQTLSSDIERRAMAMTALLEPIMILTMGAVVLVIVLAVMLPIMEINQMVG